MNRRQFLAGATALAAAPLTAQNKQPNCLLLAGDQLSRMREAAKRNHPAMLGKIADSGLRGGPWSVTAHRPAGAPGAAGVHDYFSEGPYWWPNPKDPNGPYIRKDGARNPDRFVANHNDLDKMCEAVLSLGIGAYLLGRQECAARAATVLNTWFVDPKTSMNPNLEFGQAVRGKNSGRATGLIDTVPLIHAVQGVRLLEVAGALEQPVSHGMRDWFRQFSTWMTTSKKGLEEKDAGNNHATWWTAQVAAYAMFTGDNEMRTMAWNHYREFLVPKQIRKDGSCPEEEARTDSLNYSSMNLDAFSIICRLAQVSGLDLWHYQAPNGANVDAAFHYLMPYVLDPIAWKKEQMNRFTVGGYVFPGLAGVGLPAADLLATYKKLPRNDSPWVQFIDLLVETSA